MSWFRSTIAVSCSLLLWCESGAAWSNRGHRLVNLVAAERLPADMPAFMRSPAAVAEISYLGPEPDRWRPDTVPDLSRVSSPDHIFRYETGVAIGTLPRRRYDYLMLLDDLRQRHPEQASQLTPQFTGTLPWTVEEVYQRLVSTFIDYRLVLGELPPESGKEMIPMTKEDLPYIEAAALYYAGWLGHYVADGSMPLHSSQNVSGWAEKENPQGYTTKGSIHHQLEVVADNAIADHRVTAKRIEEQMPAARIIGDPFAGTLQYLRVEGRHTEQVYRWEKQGSLTGDGTPEVDDFIEKRMAEGGAMLRDLIYSAWVQSKELKAPAAPMTVTLEAR